MNENKTQSTNIDAPATYTNSFTFLAITCLLWVMGLLFILSIRRRVGYSGSEGEIGAYIFVLPALIFSVVTPLHFAITLLKRRGVKTATLRFIKGAMAALFIIAPLTSFTINFRAQARPMSKSEVIQLINNCEVYNVNREFGNKVIVNYKDKDISHHRTNGADAKYFDAYVDAAKRNTTCEVQTHDAQNATTPLGQW